MKSGRSTFLFALVYTCLVSGCALQSAQPPAEKDPSITETSAEPPQRPVRPFPPETLYSLLAAEIAGGRQQYEIALSNYTQQARQTRDPQVAERATMIARYLNANEVASETALLWVELEPESDAALSNATVALLQSGRALEAFEMSQRLQAKGLETLYQNIAANASDLPEDERETLLQAYLQQLQATPENEQLLVGTGLLLQMQGKPEEALGYARTAIELDPDSVAAGLLETHLLHQLQRDQEAIARLDKLLDMHPTNIRLRLQYARILAHNDLARAQEQFEILTEQAPDDGDLRLSLALVAMERKDFDTAAAAFEHLLDSNQHLSTAHYSLGQIAEQRGDQAKALLHYLSVEPGREFARATVNLLNIMIKQGDLISASEHIQRLSANSPAQTPAFQQLHAQALTKYKHYTAAEQVLDQALALSPRNTQLLFTRGLLYDTQGRLADAERDLRTIIEDEPDNSAALNALGYILIDRTDRLDEASGYLLQAITLNPNDPAILDSVGWLYYRTDNYPEALAYLRRAFAAYPDAEIAAHLGEVLWTIGKRDEALGIWQHGLELAPDSEIIRDTMERLQVKPQ
jgi:tetratricopeptide (TPR) repeat protein